MLDESEDEGPSMSSRSLRCAVVLGSSFVRRVNPFLTTASLRVAPSKHCFMMNRSFILMRSWDDVRVLVELQVVYVLLILEHKLHCEQSRSKIQFSTA